MQRDSYWGYSSFFFGHDVGDDRFLHFSQLLFDLRWWGDLFHRFPAVIGHSSISGSTATQMGASLDAFTPGITAVHMLAFIDWSSIGRSTRHSIIFSWPSTTTDSEFALERTNSTGNNDTELDALMYTDRCYCF
jgi:hypothetical protein